MFGKQVYAFISSYIWRVVRWLSRCAKDHYTVQSQAVLQHCSGLYCLCCHSDKQYSPPQSADTLIVSASSGLFLFMDICAPTNTTQIHFIHLLPMNTHYHTFRVSVGFFYSWVLMLYPGTDTTVLTITKWAQRYSSPTEHHASPLQIHIPPPRRPQ